MVHRLSQGPGQKCSTRVSDENLNAALGVHFNVGFTVCVHNCYKSKKEFRILNQKRGNIHGAKVFCAVSLSSVACILMPDAAFSAIVGAFGFSFNS